MKKQFLPEKFVVYALGPLVGGKNGLSVGNRLSIVVKNVGEVESSTINGSNTYLS